MIIIGAALLLYGGWLYMYRWEQSDRVGRDWQDMNNHGVLTGLFIGAGMVIIMMELVGMIIS